MPNESWSFASRVPTEKEQLAAGPRPALGDRYRLEEELGRGAMGVVWRATDLELSREVAIKVLSRATPRGRARFLLEASAIGKLDHPNVVRIHSIGESEGQPYLVLQLIEGATTLDVASRIMSVADGLGAILVTARALGHAHERGLVHRDVKPGNVLLDSKGQLFLNDFGLVLDREADLERLTLSGVFVGTPCYMAPEQLEAKRDLVGPHSDVYALGVMLYEVLTGTRPHPSNSLPSLMWAIKRPPKIPSAVAAHPYPSLDRVCLRALATNPSDRYPDASAFAAALHAGIQDPGKRGNSRPLVYVAILLAVWAGLAVVGGPEQTPRGAALSPSPSAETSPTQSPQTALVVSTTPPGSLPLDLPPGLTRTKTQGVVRNARDGSELVWIPPAKYRVRFDALSSRTIQLSVGFYLGRYEVTWAQYGAYCKAEGIRLPPRRIRDYVAGEQDPVFNVSWDAARAYCAWAGLQLPADAQLACAAGEWVDPPRGNFVGDEDGFPFLAPVGQAGDLSPTGCFDLWGNVSEWTADPNWIPLGKFLRDPVPPRSGQTRLIRGAHWSLRPTPRRSERWPGTLTNSIGFRVSLGIGAVLPLEDKRD
ncbi:MAG: protein kinase [Planctomycetes bacterium]|nr:protein kinase [Planctomycetota bacterium]